MDTTKALRVFVEVARRGTFAAAAQPLGISTSSLSRLIGELETWLGTALFRRTTRSLTLTDAGRQFLQRSAALVDATDALQRDALALSDDPSGLLTVSGSSYLMRKRIAPLLPGFIGTNPHVRLNLLLRDEPVDVVGEGIDIAIRIGELEDSALIARKCGEVALRLTASPAFLTSHGTPQTPEEVASFPCLVDTIPKHRNRWPLGNRVSVDGPVTANDGEIVREMTLAGLGLSLLPDMFVEEDLAEGRLVSILEDDMRAGIGIYALFPAQRRMTAAARAFVDCLAEQLSKTRQRPEAC